MPCQELSLSLLLNILHLAAGNQYDTIVYACVEVSRSGSAHCALNDSAKPLLWLVCMPCGMQHTQCTVQLGGTKLVPVLAVHVLLHSVARTAHMPHVCLLAMGYIATLCYMNSTHITCAVQHCMA